MVSGDTIVVKPKGGKERRLQIASIRAPKMPNLRRTDDPELAKGQPYAREAKEFLRQRLVGKNVSVKLRICLE